MFPPRVETAALSLLVTTQEIHSTFQLQIAENAKPPGDLQNSFRRNKSWVTSDPKINTLGRTEFLCAH